MSSFNYFSSRTAHILDHKIEVLKFLNDNMSEQVITVLKLSRVSGAANFKYTFTIFQNSITALKKINCTFLFLEFWMQL